MAQEQPVALSSAPITAVLQRSVPVSKPVLTREPVSVPVWEPVPASVPVLELFTVSQAQPVGQNQVQPPPQASSVP